MFENSTPEYLPRGILLDNFIIESVLGRGSFGITYLARNETLQNQVAIKEYLPRDVAFRKADAKVYPFSDEKNENFQYGMESFLEEARTIVKFRHPNIVRVLSFFRKNGTAYIVMEYEKGQTLKYYVNNNKTISEDQLLAIFCPICHGLAVMHTLDYIHRDIKPDNIVIREDGTPVLIDFGTARYTGRQKSEEFTQIFTEGYAPYEQCNPMWSKQGAWTDIYSLGATLYFVLSKKRLIPSQIRVIDDPFEPLKREDYIRYSPHIIDAINWSLAFHPDNRPPSIIQWHDVLCQRQSIGTTHQHNPIEDASTVIIQVPSLPFHPNRPCLQPTEHAGRKTLIQHVFGKLATDDVQSFAIIGFRKSGKTSFINHIQQPKILVEYLEEEHDYYFFITMSLSELQLKNKSEFFSAFFYAVEKNIGLDNLHDISDLQVISAWLQLHKKRLVLILDDFDHIITCSNFSVAFYESLRSWFSTNPNVGCIVTSPVQLLHLSIPMELAGSPFFNIFGSYTLPPLNENEAMSLLKERLPYVLTVHHQDEIKALIKDVGVNPYELQKAGDFWMQSYQKKGIIRYQDIREDVYKIYSDYYHSIYLSLTKKQIRIIRLLLSNPKQEKKLTIFDPELINRGWVTRDGTAILSHHLNAYFIQTLGSKGEKKPSILDISRAFFKKVFKF